MEIGITAGEIWHYLDKHHHATMDELVRALNKPRELVSMSLGWLAREGHILLTSEKAGYQARLSNRP